MKSNKKIYLACFGVVIFLFAAGKVLDLIVAQQFAKPILSGPYKVLHVVDGDTFDVKINGLRKRIRSLGLDTPETVDPRKSVQCFGVEASNKAKEILNSQTVFLEADSSQANLDKYGRLLRYAWLRDGINFSEIMIRQGYAREYTYLGNPYKYQIRFKQAQQEAVGAGRGLWSADNCASNVI